MKRAAALLLVPIALVAVSCGDDDPSTVSQEGTSSTASEGSTAVDDFNEADVAFAQDMIPHHEQAVEMANLAADRAESDEVKDLASSIAAAQGPEIETMTAWLEAWGEETTDSAMGGMDHGGSGMMSEDEMADLEAATGAEFDELFLEMMREHHEGAIEMATTELDEGQNAEALELAQKIVDDQTAELDEIDRLLGRG